MPLYKWKGISADGSARAGSQTAVSPEHLTTALLSNNIALLSYSETSSTRSIFTSLIKHKITQEQLILFFEELELLLGSGIELVRALKTITDTLPHKSLQKIALELVDSITHGHSFYTSLQKHPTTFPLFAINLIASGEKTGKLSQTITYIKHHLKQQSAIKRQLRSAALGPIVTVLLAGTLIFGIIAFIVPYFQTLYQTLGKPIPASTQRLIAFNNFITSWTGTIGFGVLCMALFFVKILVTSNYAKNLKDRIILQTPIIKTVTTYKHRIIFTQTMTLFLQAGLPLTQALAQTLHQSSNTVFLETIQTLMMHISSGTSLYAAMAIHPSPFFDTHFSAMVLVGEQSGKLDHVLDKIANHTQDRLTTYLATLATLFTPILLIFTGGIVAYLLIVIYLPIFNLGSLFGA